ncbi:MAG: hypothetical protein ACYCRH_04675 [Acidiferrobacteraceae bacterium]
MNRFRIRQPWTRNRLSCLQNGHPSPNASILMDRFPRWLRHHPIDPLPLDHYPARTLMPALEVLRLFHRQSLAKVRRPGKHGVPDPDLGAPPDQRPNGFRST